MRPVDDPTRPLAVGDRLVWFCGGAFGRDSYGDKVIEGIGKDWVVVREIDTGDAVFTTGNIKDLREYRV